MTYTERQRSKLVVNFGRPQPIIVWCGGGVHIAEEHEHEGVYLDEWHQLAAPEGKPTGLLVWEGDVWWDDLDLDQDGHINFEGTWRAPTDQELAALEALLPRPAPTDTLTRK